MLHICIINDLKTKSVKDGHHLLNWYHISTIYLHYMLHSELKWCPSSSMIFPRDFTKFQRKQVFSGMIDWTKWKQQFNEILCLPVDSWCANQSSDCVDILSFNLQCIPWIGTRTCTYRYNEIQWNTMKLLGPINTMKYFQWSCNTVGH